MPPQEEDAAGPQADASVERSDCTVEGAFAIPLEESGARGWIALQQADVVHVVYTARGCGAAEANGSVLLHVALDAKGALGKAKHLTQPDEGICSTALAPALSYDPQRGLQLFFTSDALGSYELFHRAVDGAASPVQLTFDPAGALDNELETAAAAVNGTPVIAYSNRLRRTDPGGIVARTASGNEVEILPPSANQSPIRLTFAVGRGATEVGLLGWVNQQATGSTISMQVIDASAAPLGPRVELTQSAGEASTVAFASSAAHAAVLYTVARGSNHELRYRQLDAAGQPSGSEVPLTSGNRSVVNASIAPYANGYVVAFREVPLDLATTASLRLMFITQQGIVGGERRLADAARGGGESQVFVANDGRIVVAWSDYAAAGSTLQIVRARCL